MDFALSDEHRMLKDLIARFVRDELMLLEKVVLEREAAGQGVMLTAEERHPIDRKSCEVGLRGLDAPEDVGGTDLRTSPSSASTKSWVKPSRPMCFHRIRRISAC